MARAVLALPSRSPGRCSCVLAAALGTGHCAVTGARALSVDSLRDLASGDGPRLTCPHGSSRSARPHRRRRTGSEGNADRLVAGHRGLAPRTDSRRPVNDGMVGTDRTGSEATRSTGTDAGVGRISDARESQWT